MLVTFKVCHYATNFGLPNVRPLLLQVLEVALVTALLTLLTSSGVLLVGGDLGPLCEKGPDFR